MIRAFRFTLASPSAVYNPGGVILFIRALINSIG